MVFKPADCASQDISWRICSYPLLLMYFWQNLLVCFVLLSCRSSNPWPTRHLQDGTAWCSKYSVIARLIQFSFYQEQIPDLQQTKSLNTIIAHPLLYRCCNTGDSSSFTNFTSHVDPAIWAKDFELWFVSAKEFFLLLNWQVCALTDWSLFRSFFFLNSAFLVEILPYRPAPQRLFLIVDVDTFFSRHWFSWAVMLRAISLLSRKLVTLMKLSSA